MAQTNTVRMSHCQVCGKRLSVKTASGSILWKPSHVDDKGIHCDSCAPPSKSGKPRRSNKK